MRKTALFAFNIFLVCTSVWAQDNFDVTPLYQSADWEVVTVYNNSSGKLSCRAATYNNRNQSLAITVSPNEAPWLAVSDPLWNIPYADTDFYLDVGANRWEMFGTGSGSAVVVPLDGFGDVSMDLIADLSVQTTATVLNLDLEHLAVFSLRGSSDALAAFLTCRDRLPSAVNPF